MRRRNFINQIAALGSLTLTGFPQLACTAPSKYKMGLQLFSVRDAMAEDPVGTLKKVKAMGYQDFETYGFNPDTKRIYGLEVGEFKMVLDDLGLTTTSGHYAFSDYFNATEDKLKEFVDQCIEASKILNAPYITCLGCILISATRRASKFWRISSIELVNKLKEQALDLLITITVMNLKTGKVVQATIY